MTYTDFNEEKINFAFDLEQAKEICYQIRKNNIIFSDRLNEFYTGIQNFIYSSMTIDEAERFFNEI